MTISVDRPQPWMKYRACDQVDPDIWFPEKGGTSRPAKDICKTCDVRLECLEYALEVEGTLCLALRFGVWGGLDAKERHELMKRREANAERRRQRQQPAREDTAA